MSLSVINDGSDILWIATRIPGIASIYYYLHLQNTHTLYCPDDISPTPDSNSIAPVKQHVRDLARNILHVIDSNNYKKLALHFMEPMTTTRRDDLIRFLLKRRPRLRLSHLTLPCPTIQHCYLSGWSYSFSDGFNSIWSRLCRASPTQEPGSPSPCIPAENTYADMEFKQPFMLSSHEFIKKALFVYITQDMIIPQDNIADTNDDMNLFQLKDGALLAIQGWIDAISTLPSQEERKQMLTHGRQQLWKKIGSLATELPIYLYLNYFSIAPTAILSGTLAWLQQRHHLCVELTSIARYDRPKWKTEFIELLQKLNSISYTDQRYISPEKLNNDFSVPGLSKHYATPLINCDEQPFAKIRHESGEYFDHSVSSSNEHVANSWIIAVKQQQLRYDTITTRDNTDGNDSNNTVVNVDKQDDVSWPRSSMTDEARAEELENLADKIEHDKIRIYIANTGAYSLMIFAKAKGTSNEPYQVYMALNRKDDIELVRNGYCTCPVGGTGKCKHCVAVLLRFTINVDDFQQAEEQIVMPTVKQDSRTKRTPQSSSNGEKASHSDKTSAAVSISAASAAASPSESPSSQSQSQSQPQPQPQTSPHTNTSADIHETSSEAIQSDPSLPLIKPTEQNLDVIPTIDDFPKTSTPLSSADTNANIETDIPSQRRRVLPWNMEQQKQGRSRKKQRVNEKSTKTTTKAQKAEVLPDTQTTPTHLLSIHQPAAENANSKPRRTNTKRKTKARRTSDCGTDSDSKSDTDWENSRRQSDTAKIPSRRSRKSKQQQPTTYTIEESVMWEDDTEFISKQPSQLLQHVSSPKITPTSTPNFNMSMTIDNDDPVSTTDTLTASSQLSPLRPMQKSNLSLPMTDLELLNSKSGVIDDSDTQDEDDDWPLSLQLMNKSPQTSVNKEKYEQQHFDNTAVTQQQRQLMYDTQASIQKSTTADLFDELDL
ncbi:hypothetical protein BCR42DRAFT_422332 [Absidia repens]|uniref:SWIM-type domain-containing protein n=1 Tax=Absidia repens TaxID=90262 RepID=A0A1X2I6E3_9FUNG|nr:hypothetical protein BCR42DRAFT_422332 [Absidia repens]